MDFTKRKLFILQFKTHERVLNDAEVSFDWKVVTTVKVWRDIASLKLAPSDILQAKQIVEWAKLHSLNIVLQADWNEFKVIYQLELIKEIHKAIENLIELSSGFVSPLKKLIDVVENPWGNPILLKLMKGSKELATEEADFFYKDTAYVVTVRLKILCESSCEDFALNLSSAFLKLLASHLSWNAKFKVTEQQIKFIFDLQIALLYKFQQFHDMFRQLKNLPVQESLELVQRFAAKKIKVLKIWQHCHNIACIASQIYITKIVLDTEENTSALKNFLEMYLKVCMKNQMFEDFISFIKRVCALSNSTNLNVICETIHLLDDSDIKPLLIEIYLKMLTIDINELEAYKIEEKPDEIRRQSSKLAVTYDKLAALFDEHLKVARECVLTSFCLHPTKQRLLMLENFAARSGFQDDTEKNWECSLHPPVFCTDEIMWRCPQCNDWMCKPQLNIPVERSLPLHDTIQYADIGISQTLCDDLIVCLSYSRYQVLSWSLPWRELHRLCIMYLDNPIATKSFITELKYVNIDYSIFRSIKQEPPDDLAGIEKGYEQYLDYSLLYGNSKYTEVSKLKQTNRAIKKSDNLKQFLNRVTPIHVTADLFQTPVVVLQKLPVQESKQISIPEKTVGTSFKDNTSSMEMMRMRLMIKMRKETGQNTCSRNTKQ